MKKFTIDRLTWNRGNPKNSYLLNSNTGKMCCLGQIALQCGYEKEEIEFLVAPAAVDDCSKFPNFLITTHELKEGTYNENSKDCQKLMRINDSMGLKDTGREKYIKTAFAAHGYEVEFIN